MKLLLAELAEIAPSFGLLFFFGIFVGIAVWVLTPSRRGKLEAYARIPLQELPHD